MRKISSPILLLVFFVAFSACKQNSGESNSQASDDQLSKEEIAKRAEEAAFPLPNPLNTYKMLQDIGATYNHDILNPISAVENYYNSNLRAVNIGTYAADLSYSLVFDNSADFDLYSKTLKKMVSDLNINIDYEKLVLLNNKTDKELSDSAVQIATQFFYDVYEFLYLESDPSLAALMVTGFYVEGLYIATHISDETFNNIEIVKIIYNQKDALADLLELNEKFAENGYLKTVNDSLKKLKAIYDSTDGSLNKEQLDSLTSIIAAIRETLVS